MRSLKGMEITEPSGYSRVIAAIRVSAVLTVKALSRHDDIKIHYIMSSNVPVTSFHLGAHLAIRRVSVTHSLNHSQPCLSDIVSANT